jgi:hypothetical protein
VFLVAEIETDSNASSETTFSSKCHLLDTVLITDGNLATVHPQCKILPIAGPCTA